MLDIRRTAISSSVVWLEKVKQLKMNLLDWFLWGTAACALVGLVFLFFSLCYYNLGSYYTCRENQLDLRAAVDLYIKNGSQLVGPSSLDELIPNYFFELPQCSKGKYEYKAEIQSDGEYSYRISCSSHGEMK